MRVLWVARKYDTEENVITMNFIEARKQFLKDSFDALDIYFEDLQIKGNFSQRFQIWKKIGKFGTDEGIMIHDCRNKRKKDKLICETRKEFPEDESFLEKYLIQETLK